MGRPESADRVVFELEDDDSATPTAGPGGEPGTDAEPGVWDGDGPVRLSVPARPWWRRRRWWFLAVFVLGLVVAVVVDEVGEYRERTERLMGAPGGVLSLEGPPRERWRVPDVAGPWPSAELVVATVRGDVVGLDPRSGEVVADFGPAATTLCGPEVGRPEYPVCVPPDGDPPRVPGPDGTFLTAERIGPEPGDSPVSSSCEGGVCQWFGAITDARDVRVEATDAATGAVRWRRTIEFRTVGRAERCADGAELDLESVTLATTAHTVLVEGCGIDAWVAANGRVLERARSIRGDVEVLARPDGGYRAWARAGAIGTGLTLMFGPDGEGERDASGVVLDPVATDGSPGAVTLVQRGAQLLHVGEDGRILWNVDQTAELFLARTQREGVLLDREGVAIGIDLASGETVWRTQVGMPADGAWNGYEDEVAFTDGRRVTILVEGEGGARRAVTLDLRSGDGRWSWDVPDGWVVRAVNGRLVAEANGDLVGLG
ncbi:hypothetical protein [Myceligenerans pegani]|uniref:Pyrroloquinoline-quinone binding quinoprotein n=1 Tax=Myceligenerans pegani TaxID=2776917 RepID=A0ABR9N2S5_9MICO|nr:hypothetical protein [Myceligenerans sp. TRM 65318]MBE1877954.1 hypothetical protein [Myceligenerans sp. TRM 65318]MBE3020225.1 hypothetical protein [Myceligenerans sp. TRM 65318]